jgi:hypothetical protein
VKAVCVALRGGRTNSPWLTLHGEYQILSILMTPSGPAKLRILADDGRTPILVDAAMFSMNSQPLPDTWVAIIEEGGIVELGPRSWLKPGFWERYFDGDADAMTQFQREMSNMARLLRDQSGL